MWVLHKDSEKLICRKLQVLWWSLVNGVAKVYISVLESYSWSQWEQNIKFKFINHAKIEKMIISS